MVPEVLRRPVRERRLVVRKLMYAGPDLLVRRAKNPIMQRMSAEPQGCTAHANLKILKI